MATEWISPIRIINEKLLGCEFKLDPLEDRTKDDLELGVQFNTEHELIEENHVCRIVLQVRVQGESEETSPCAFSVFCSLGMTICINAACFEDESQDEIKECMDANALSLCFGKARSFLQEVASRSQLGPIVVPAINPFALVQAVKESDDGER